MGMGMSQKNWEWDWREWELNRWEWEGTGMLKAIPAHLYGERAKVLLSVEIQYSKAKNPSTQSAPCRLAP